MKVEHFEFLITDDPEQLDTGYSTTPELAKKLDAYQDMALSRKRSNVRKLEAAVKKYPNNPQVKNFLLTLYTQLGDDENADKLNERISREHPDYLFGKISRAYEYNLKGQYDKMKGVLGERMILQDLYPQRKAYHPTEVLGFMTATIAYYAGIENFEQAEKNYEIVEKIAPDTHYTLTARQIIAEGRLSATQRLLKESVRNRIYVKVEPQPVLQVQEAPVFNHEEVNWLYQYGLDIGQEKLNALLSLPKETFLQDLGVVIQDSVTRFGHFYEIALQDDWGEEDTCFPYHALHLIGELGDERGLESILLAFSQTQEYFDLYFSNLDVSDTWMAVYKLGLSTLEPLKTFICKPGIDFDGRSIVCNTVGQIGLHQGKRRKEVLGWYRDVLQFFLDSKREDNVLDTVLIDQIIANVLSLKGSELLPKIQALYDRGLVVHTLVGNLEDVKDGFSNPKKEDSRLPVRSIIEYYEEINEILSGDWDEDPMDFDFRPELMEKFMQQHTSPTLAEPKVGRNDPCPCGSGKKYKKCCAD